MASEAWTESFVVWDGANRWRVEPSLNRLVEVPGEAPGEASGTGEDGPPTEPQAEGAQAEEVNQLEPRVMDVLVALARRAGEVCTREDLLDAVWADTVVNEEALTRAVSEIRKAFGDRASDPSIVETIRGTGYRFIARVERVSAAGTPAGEDRSEHMPGDAAAEPRPADREAAPATSTSFPPKNESSAPLPGGWPTWLVGGAALALVVAAVVWAAPWASSSGSSPVLLQTEPFTSYLGRERFAALSPDGSRVAFSWAGGASDTADYDIYVKQANTPEPLRLTRDPEHEAFAAWTADGTTLAFVRLTGEGRSAVYTVPALGGEPRKLFDVPSVAYGLDWTPDGASLVYAAREEAGTSLRVMRYDLDTGATTVLSTPPGPSVDDIQPVVSPDGETVAFGRRRRPGGHNLYVAPIGGGEARRVTEDELAINGLDWLPGGDRLVYASYQSGTFGLWTVEVATGETTWLPTRAERIYGPSVAAQTGAIVYEELTYEKDVWQIDLDASHRVVGETPIITSTRWDCEAYYSPSGERLVFTSARSGSMELWMSRADGSNPVQLTRFGGAFVGNPRWSPDGERVAFYATPNGRAEVFVVDVEGGTPRAVRPDSDGEAGRANHWVTSWSRDGAWLYAASDRSGAWQLWKMRPDGSEIRQVTVDGGFAAHESVDGDTLYYAKHAVRGLYARPVGGGEETQVVEDLSPADWGNWAVTSDAIYYVRRGAETQVVRHPLGAGASSVVTSLPTLASPSLEVSRDGRRILYARIERVNGDLIYSRGL